MQTATSPVETPGQDRSSCVDQGRYGWRLLGLGHPKQPGGKCRPCGQVRIYRTYGADAVQVMSENPYCLARDIRGIGFKTADAIAMKLGVDKTAMVRVRAGISYALTEADEGHCGLPADELVPLAEKLLEVPQERAGFSRRDRR